MTPEASAAAAVRPTIHPAAVHAALGNKLRWEMMAMMVDGKTLTAREASRTLRQDVNTIMKHLRLLRRMGLIRSAALHLQGETCVVGESGQSMSDAKHTEELVHA